VAALSQAMAADANQTMGALAPYLGCMAGMSAEEMSEARSASLSGGRSQSSAPQTAAEGPGLEARMGAVETTLAAMNANMVAMHRLLSIQVQQGTARVAAAGPALPMPQQPSSSDENGVQPLLPQPA